MSKTDRTIHQMSAERVANRERFKASGAAGSHGDRRLKRQKTRASQKAKAFSEYR